MAPCVLDCGYCQPQNRAGPEYREARCKARFLQQTAGLWGTPLLDQDHETNDYNEEKTIE